MSGNSYCTIVPTYSARRAKEASRHTGVPGIENETEQLVLNTCCLSWIINYSSLSLILSLMFSLRTSLSFELEQIQKISIIPTIHTLSTTSGSPTLAWYASLSLSSLPQYIHKVKLRLLFDIVFSMAHSMSAKVGSGSEAQMHNRSKSGDLVGIGSWANGRGLEYKVSKKTDKNNKEKAASGDSLDRQSRTKNSEWNKNPMTMWLNEDRNAGPWSHVK